MKVEVGFLPADKCQMFPQIDTIILGAFGKACPNYPKYVTMSLQCLKKKLEMKFNMWKDNNHFLTNPSFLLKIFDDAFQACLCLLSSHV